MKKIVTAILALAMVASMMVGCGSKKPAETTVPTTEAAVETTVPAETEALEGTESLEETEALEMTELEKLVEAVYAAHAPIDLPLMTMVQDLSDLDALKYNTGLTSADKIGTLVVSEPMMGQAYSLVMAEVAEGASAAELAQEIFDSIDQRKWICVEADTKVAAYTDTVVMVFMIDSGFSDTATTDSMVEAFKTAVGTDVTVIG